MTAGVWKTSALVAVLSVSALGFGVARAQETAELQGTMLQSTGSQKMCVFSYNNGTTHDNVQFSIPAPELWTVYTCRAYAQRLGFSGGKYALECLFDTSDPATGSSRSSFVGTSSVASVPPMNCGW
jgi:hypothetical protein